MTTLVIDIECNNDAFFDADGEPNPNPEIARILRHLAKRFATCSSDDYPSTVHDANGNKVGTVQFMDD
jgi:hypothetical protein